MTDPNLRNQAAIFALFLSAALACTGCGGASKAQKRAYRADEAVSKERLRLVDEYDRCIREAGEDWNKAQTCERFLKSAEALK
jgi:hypothetical protein